MINLDEYKSIGPHWIALYVNGDNVIYFDSFEVEHNPNEIKKLIENKNSKTNIYRIQANDSIMREYACIGFTDFMLKGKNLLDYANFFCRDEYEKNVKIIEITEIFQ